MNIDIIGLGGIGSWMAPQIAKLLCSNRAEANSQLQLWDADIIEEKNLDRQFFGMGQIGLTKAEAVHTNLMESMTNANLDKLTIIERREYFHRGAIPLDNSIIICCADNHPARLATLEAIDRHHTWGIICGNETVDAEAYIYFSAWKDGILDPRNYYPDIKTDTTGSPIQAGGCQGEITLSTPQLGMANQFAAVAAMYLLWTWEFSEEGADAEIDLMPIRHTISQFGCRTVKAPELREQHQQKQP